MIPFGLIVDILFIAVLILGFFIGYIRGARKSLFKLILTCLLVGASFLLCLALSGILYKFDFGFILNSIDKSLPTSLTLDGLPAFLEQYDTGNSILNSLILEMKTNPESMRIIVEIILSVFKIFLFFIIYLGLWITSNILLIILRIFGIGKFRKVDRNGNRIKPRRFIGAVFGSLGAFIASTTILVPVVGLNNLYRIGMNYDSIASYVPEDFQDVDLISNTIFSNLFGGIPQAYFNTLTSYTIGGNTYNLTSDVTQILKVLNATLQLMGDDNMNFMQMPQALIDQKVNILTDALTDATETSFINLLPAAVNVACITLSNNNGKDYCTDYGVNEIPYSDLLEVDSEGNTQYKKEFESFGTIVKEIAEIRKYATNENDEMIYLEGHDGEGGYELRSESFDIATVTHEFTGNIFEQMGSSVIIKTLLPATLDMMSTQMSEAISASVIAGQSLDEVISLSKAIGVLKGLTTSVDYRVEGEAIGALFEIISALKKDGDEFALDLSSDALSNARSLLTDLSTVIDSSDLVNTIIPGSLSVLLSIGMQDLGTENSITTDIIVPENIVVTDELRGLLSLFEVINLLQEESAESTTFVGLEKTTLQEVFNKIDDLESDLDNSKILSNFLPGTLSLMISSALNSFGANKISSKQTYQNVVVSDELKGFISLLMVASDLNSEDELIDDSPEALAESSITIEDKRNDLNSSQILESLVPEFIINLVNSSLESSVNGQTLDTDDIDTDPNVTYNIANELNGMIELIRFVPIIDEVADPENEDLVGTRVANNLTNISDTNCVLVRDIVKRFFNNNASTLFAVEYGDLFNLDWENMDPFEDAALLGSAIDFGNRINAGGSDISTMSATDIVEIFDLLHSVPNKTAADNLIRDIISNNAGSASSSVIDLISWEYVNYHDEGQALSALNDIMSNPDRTVNELVDAAINLADHKISLVAATNSSTSATYSQNITSIEKDALITAMSTAVDADNNPKFYTVEIVDGMPTVIPTPEAICLSILFGFNVNDISII